MKKPGSVNLRPVDSFDAFIGSGEEGSPLAAEEQTERMRGRQAGSKL
jgi:hypothetical protein